MRDWRRAANSQQFGPSVAGNHWMMEPDCRYNQVNNVQQDGGRLREAKVTTTRNQPASNARPHQPSPTVTADTHPSSEVERDLELYPRSALNITAPGHIIAGD